MKVLATSDSKKSFFKSREDVHDARMDDEEDDLYADKLESINKNCIPCGTLPFS